MKITLGNVTIEVDSVNVTQEQLKTAREVINAEITLNIAWGLSTTECSLIKDGHIIKAIRSLRDRTNPMISLKEAVGIVNKYKAEVEAAKP